MIHEHRQQGNPLDKMSWTQLQHLQPSFEPRTCDCSLKPAMFPSASALRKRMEKGWLSNSPGNCRPKWVLRPKDFFNTRFHMVPFKSIPHRKVCSCDWKLRSSCIGSLPGWCREETYLNWPKLKVTSRFWDWVSWFGRNRLQNQNSWQESCRQI